LVTVVAIRAVTWVWPEEESLCTVDADLIETVDVWRSIFTKQKERDDA
jgi:hypothetical protein